MSGYPVKFGKYLLLERVNVGGMAEVFKAKTFGVAGFERILAIKRILPSLVEDEEFIRMFIDEARIAVQLNHPNIVQIYELGKHGDHYYIAMEYLASRDLRGILDRLRSNGQLMPIPQAAFVTSKLCEGLHYAHRKADPHGQPMNIIHRDVSPQNVLVSYEGEIKIIDFGIAKAANRASKTQAGVLKGKFGYMSPEQVRGLPIDRRSDIFAVGVLLYEMLTGERLFIGESDFSTLERVRNAEVPPPTTFNKKISPELEQIVLKALAREVEDRYQWSSELADDLQRFLIEDRSIYSAKRLAAYMKETYSEEVSAERRKQEEFLKLTPEEYKRRKRGDDFDPAPEQAPRTAEAPVSDPAERAPELPPDGIEFEDDADEFEDDKTFVIEASEAGQMLNVGDDKDDDKPAPPNEDFLNDPSLYGDDLEEDEDDSKTQVSFTNPFDEGEQGGPPGPPPPSNTGATPQQAKSGALDARVSPNAPTAMMPAVSDEDLGLKTESESVGPDRTAASISTSVPDSPPSAQIGQTEPRVPMPTTPASATSQSMEEPAAARPQAAGLSKGCLFGIIAGLGGSFIVVLAAVGLAIWAVSQSGGPTTSVVRIASDETPPADLAVLVDDEKVADALPAQFETSPGAHAFKVMSGETVAWEMVVPKLVAGQSLTLKARFADAANDDEDKPPKGDGEPDETVASKDKGETTDKDKDSDKVAAADAAVPKDNDASGQAGDQPAADADDDAPKAALVAAGPLVKEGAERWRLSFAAVHRTERQPVYGAKVLYKDEVIGVTPFERDFPGDLEKVKLRIEADGFVNKEVVFVREGREHVGPASVPLATAKAVKGEDKDGDGDKVATEDGDGEDQAGDEGKDEKAADGETKRAAKDEGKDDDPDKVAAKDSGGDKPEKKAADKGEKKSESKKVAKAEQKKTRKSEQKAKTASKDRGDKDKGKTTNRKQKASSKKSGRGAKKKTAKADAGGTVELSVGARPKLEVFVDKKKRGKTPLYGKYAVKLSVGTHFLMMVDPATKKRYKFKVTLNKPGKARLSFDAKAEKMTAVGAVKANRLK